jgi:hypothetical protein
MHRVVGLIAVTIALAGRVLAEDAPAVTVVDQRSAESIKYYRESTFSAIVYLGDKALKSPPVERLREALTKRATQPLSVVVTEMRLIDFFPTRLKAGPGGMVTNSIMKGLVDSKTDWSFVKDVGIPNNTDAIICLFAGTANGKEIKLATHAPYKVSAFTLRIDTSKPYLAAFDSVYEQTAQKIIDQVGSTKATPPDGIVAQVRTWP